MKTNHETMTEAEALRKTPARALLHGPPLLRELYQAAEYPAHKPALRAWVTTPLVPLTRTLHEGLETPQDVARALSPDASDRARLGDDGLFSSTVLRGLIFVREVRRERCPFPPPFAVPSVSARDLAWFSLFFREALTADPLLAARREGMQARWSEYFRDRNGGLTATSFRTSAEYMDSYMRGAAYERARLEMGGRDWAEMTGQELGAVVGRVYAELYGDGHPLYVSKSAPKATSPDWNEPRYPLRADVGVAACYGVMGRELGRIVARHQGARDRRLNNWWIEIVAPGDPDLPFDTTSKGRAAQASRPAVA